MARLLGYKPSTLLLSTFYIPPYYGIIKIFIYILVVTSLAKSYMFIA